MRLALLVAAAVVALSGCGDDNGAVDMSDTTPPSKVAMDAFLTNRAGQGVTVSVSTTSGNKAVTLDNLPDIALLAGAEDPESAVERLDIRGETTVWCEGPELGQSKHATWLKPALGGDAPRFKREVALTVQLGKQSPLDTEYIGKCPPDMKLTAINGEFWAVAWNGVNLSGRTGTFSFSWQRPS